MFTILTLLDADERCSSQTAVPGEEERAWQPFGVPGCAERCQAPLSARYLASMAKLSAEEVRSGWRASGLDAGGDAIRRQFVFDGFASAVAFVVRIGFDAEAADHHPDILISNYKKVTVTFTTHSADGLTEKDFAGAEAVDRVFGG